MPYYTNPEVKRQIDLILTEVANLFANCDDQNRAYAKEQEQTLLKEVHKLDPTFAARCGYRD
jgi:hypothetical protein